MSRAGILSAVLMLTTVSLTGCNGFFGEPEEAPPNRVRSLNRPGWASPDQDNKTSAVVDVAKTEAVATPTPAPEGFAGIVGRLIDKYRQTERGQERERAVQSALPDVTEKDVAEAVRATQSGKRLEAEVGMAIITGYYTNLKEWRKIEEQYKNLFIAVPELRFDPTHLLEHAWAMMKLGTFQKSVERATEAERYFSNLPTGVDPTLHRARVLECRAWSYEGLFRESVAKGNDEDTALYRERAIKEWEDFRDLLKPLTASNKEIADRVALAEDHIAGFKGRN